MLVAPAVESGDDDPRGLITIDGSLKRQAQSIRRQQRAGAVGPFNHGHLLRVKRLQEAKARDFIGIIEPIEIEVTDEQAGWVSRRRAGPIPLLEHEGRTAGPVGAAESGRQPLDPGGFARADRADQRDRLAAAQRAGDSAGKPVGLSGRPDGEGGVIGGRGYLDVGACAERAKMGPPLPPRPEPP